MVMEKSVTVNDFWYKQINYNNLHGLMVYSISVYGNTNKGYIWFSHTWRLICFIKLWSIFDQTWRLLPSLDIRASCWWCKTSTLLRCRDVHLWRSLKKYLNMKKINGQFTALFSFLLVFLYSQQKINVK